MNKQRAKLWLKTHPPPRNWKGTALEYAELEMVDPLWLVLGAIVVVAVVWRSVPPKTAATTQPKTQTNFAT